MQFTALVDFWSDETKSQYCVGLTYRMDSTAQMFRLVQQWLSERKIAPWLEPRAELTGRE
jgi:hypothetical protein